jgi:TonB-linked SusC/RagA family outer membrane protein
MKKNYSDWGELCQSLKKTLLMMRIALVLLLVGFLQTHANDAYAQKTKVSVSFSNTELAKVLDQIENESEFFFLYNEKLIDANRKVSIEAKDERIDEVLKMLFTGTNVEYTISDRKIILAPVNMVQTQQTGKKLTGKVTDSSGATLPGVSVVVKGTTIGVITDMDGNYSLTNIPENASLQFSFVGMKPQEIAIGSKSTINVKLEEETVGIEEVVAIGYGTQKKKDLTGAVAAVSGELVAERKTTQVSQALQGAISGVTVTRNGSSGAMGTSSIRIRGITTIGDSNPLVIVDGVPVSDVNQVNPEDIENLTVLKDAASASIYGSRAASGVILITTKRAKSGQSSFNYTFENGFDTPTQIPEMVNAVGYLNMVNEMNWNDGGNGANKYPTYTQAYVDGYAANHTKDPDQYPDVNMRELVFNNTSPRQTHMVSFIGGSDFVKSSASIKYEKVGGFYDNKDYNRIFARTNNDFTINKIIGGSLDLNFKRTISTDPTYDNNGGGLLGPTLTHAPIFPAIWADGRVANGKNGDNVYGSVKFGGNEKNWYNQIGGKLSMDLKPLDGLKITGVLAPIFNFNYSKQFIKRVDAFSATDPTQFLSTLQDPWGAGKTTKLTEGRNTDYSITTQLLVNYLKSFGSHDFTILAGYENYYYKSESLSASRDQFLFDSYPYLSQGPKTYIDNSGGAYETAYRSYFGRLTYSYKSKYLIQANIRRDGSSRFASDYRWGTFPSVSAGWVASEESFVKNTGVFDFLKLRISWGALGNERIGNYPYLGVMSFSNAALYQNNVPVALQTAGQIQYAIQDISWEKTESSDLGLDANFLNNRLRFTGDVYYKKTKDMLLALQIPIFVGFENPNQNTGQMETKGIDLDLGWNDKVGELNYSVSLNLSQFTSKMGDLGGTEFLGNQVKKKGSEFNEWYGYLADGIYQTQDDVINSPKLNSNVKVGDMKYRDISGPDGVPDGKISPEYDRVLLGSSQPQWQYGGNVKLDYKGFDFSLAFQGIGKQLREIQGTSYYSAGWGNYPMNIVGKYFSTNNTQEQNLTAIYPRLTNANMGSNTAMSDYRLFDGGYFRLKNLTIGYTLPKRFTQKAMINNLRIYASASDLWCLSNFPDGYDPEGLGIVTTVLGGVSITF